jgi:uncharacterized protein YggE
MGVYMPVTTKTSPVDSISKKGSTGWSNRDTSCCDEKISINKWCCHDYGYFGKKLLLVLVGILLVYSIVLVGTLIRNNAKKFFYIGKADKIERTIVVSGFGKVTGNNDIAVTTIGYSNTDKDVAKAQANNKKVMDQVAGELKVLGVQEKDLQSNYTIFPDYNYNPQKGQELLGYKVTNELTVKVRDLSKIPQILGLAGKYGATEVGGLNFTIDDPENLKFDARSKALSDAKNKAAYLAAKLGVKLGSVIAYNEYEGGNDIYPIKTMAFGVGGGGPETISSGSKDVMMNVSVTYEILSQ